MLLCEISECNRLVLKWVGDLASGQVAVISPEKAVVINLDVVCHRTLASVRLHYCNLYARLENENQPFHLL